MKEVLKKYQVIKSYLATSPGASSFQSGLKHPLYFYILGYSYGWIRLSWTTHLIYVAMVSQETFHH